MTEKFALILYKNCNNLYELSIVEEVVIIFDKVIEVDKFLTISDICLIDLRSENEFKDGTIRGAKNIPILNNAEREEVGFTYVNKSVSEAKKLALRYASYKLEDIYNKVSYEFSNNKNLVFFCARGGMRSSTVHNLFNSLGIKNFKLDRGYKGYRKFLRENFPNYLDKIQFIVIHGKTGIGKTKILEKLEQEGYPTVNLERAANHRASFLGGVNLGEQNSQKNFETIIFHEVFDILNKSNFDSGEKINVFIEGESKRIGKIIIPDYFYNSMEKGIHICVDSPIDIRVDNLMKDYLNISLDSFKDKNFSVDQEILREFGESMILLHKYSSNTEMEEYKDLFKNSDYEGLARLLIQNYYDPKYLNSMKKHKFEFMFNCSSMDEFLNETKNLYNSLK